jgi:hypothetical protein
MYGAKKCNSFIKIIDKINKEYKYDIINIYFTELNPLSFQKIDNNVFDKFINYIENKYII